MISFTFIWNWGMANIWSWDVLPKISFLFPRMLFLGSIFRMKHTLLITTWDTAIQEGVAFFSNLSSVQLLSHVWLFATPWSAAHQASLSFTNSWSLFKLKSSDNIQPSHPLSSPSLPAFNLSQHQGLFQWVDSSYQMAKVLELQLQHQPFQWLFRLISFRIDWFDFLAVQRTLKSLLQHHSSKASLLWHSAFFYCPALTSIHDYWKNHSFD